MKNKLLIFAAALLVVVVVVGLYAKPVMADIRAALVQDIDQPARAPFQATVPVNINNFTYTVVPIPAGKRLVIDYLSFAGAAQTSGLYVQPIILLSSSVAGGPAATYYFGPSPSTTTPDNITITIRPSFIPMPCLWVRRSQAIRQPLCPST